MKQQVKINRTFDGTTTEITIDMKLCEALNTYSQSNQAFNFLIFKLDLMTDEMMESFRKKNTECEAIFREYGLSKWEIRANYDFDNCELIK